MSSESEEASSSSGSAPVSRPHTPEKPSEPVHCDSLTRLVLDSLSPVPIPGPEEELEEQRGASTSTHEAEVLLPFAADEGLLRGGAAEHLPRRAIEAGRESNGCQGDDEDGGEGYRTPTSPRHRIPARLSCPPAPMRGAARKRPWPEDRHRAVRRRLQLLDEVRPGPAADGGPPPIPGIGKGVRVWPR